MISKFLGEVKGIFNTITLMEMLISIIYILLGLIFYTNSSISGMVVSIIIGIIFIFNGLVSIISFIKRNGIDLFNSNIFFGLLFIILGILTCVLNNVLAILLGVYILIEGIQKISYGVLLHKFNESSWLLVLVIGILLMVVGIIAFFAQNSDIMEFVGVALIGYGLINFVYTLLLRRRSKYFIA